MPKAPFSWRLPLLALAGLTVAVAAAATLLYLSSLKSARERASAELSAVAALQTEALVTWRQRRELDAGHLARFRPVVEAAARAVSGLSPEDPLRLRQMLSEFVEDAGFERALVVRPNGVPLFGYVRAGAPSVPVDERLVAQALARRGRVSDLHAALGEPEPRLDVAIPLHDRAGLAIAALYVQAPLGRFISKIIGRWPVQGGAGRSFIASRDGEAVLFVASRPGDPLGGVSQRLPLDATPALTRAMEGEEGPFVARGDGGEVLLGSTRAVPSSDWRLWTAVAASEVERHIRRVALVCLVGLTLFFVTLGTGLPLWWRREATQQAALERVRRDLARSEERLTLALAGTHFVWEYDLVREQLHFDAACAGPIGVIADQLSGAAASVLRRLVHPDDLPLVQARLHAHLAGETSDFEVQHRLAHAPERWVLAHGRITQRDGEGRPLRVVGVVSEVTSIHDMRLELDRTRRLAGLGTLAAGVAHEVNNPLACVLSSLEHLDAELPLALHGRLELVGAVRDAREAAIRMRDVVRSLNAFSRPRPAAPEPVDVEDEVKAALRLAENEIRQRAHLRTALGPMPPVRAPLHELGQVFLNLLVNAAQAIPEGSRDDHAVTVTTGTDARGWAFVLVRDTGEGIAPEQQAHVFEPFFTTKAPGAGTGLGLALSHGIVTGAGGRIEVRSEPGRGSAFCVRLPPARRATAHGAAPPPPDGAEVGPRAPSNVPAPVRARTDGPTVLVVDDDPLVARSIVRSLGQGCSVTTVGSGREALAVMGAGGSFDVVLCDLMMPGMSGMDLHAEVEQRHPSLAGRFVFLTGGAFTSRSRTYLATTPCPALEKPFDPVALRELVARTAGQAAA